MVSGNKVTWFDFWNIDLVLCMRCWIDTWNK